MLASLQQRSGEAARDYARLVEVRQQLARLQIGFPRDAEGIKQRDAALSKLNDEQDRLERQLAATLPEFKHLKEVADKGPADLVYASILFGPPEIAIYSWPDWTVRTSPPSARHLSQMASFGFDLGPRWQSWADKAAFGFHCHAAAAYPWCTSARGRRARCPVSD